MAKQSRQPKAKSATPKIHPDFEPIVKRMAAAEGIPEHHARAMVMAVPKHASAHKLESMGPTQTKGRKSAD
jgi:hypothetical protein